MRHSLDYKTALLIVICIEIETFHQQILRVKDKDFFPMVLVANKADLEYERQVGSNEGRQLAKSFGCRFIETSAKQRINVDEAFYNLVREIRSYHRDQTGVKSVGGGGNAPNNVEQMQHDRSQEKDAGCCGGCVVL